MSVQATTEALTRKLGKFRGAGFGGSKTSTQTPHEDADTLRSTQHAVVIDLLSEGPIGGFVDQNWNPIKKNYAAAMWFNQSPLANDPNSWTDNFNGVSWNIAWGYVTQAPLPGSSTAEDTVAVGVTLQSHIPYIFSIDDPATTRVGVAIRIPELLYQDNKGNIYAYWVNFQFGLSMNGGPMYNLGQFQIQGKCTSDYVREYIINLPHSSTPDVDFWQISVMRVAPDDADAKHVSTSVLDFYSRIVDAPLMYPYSSLVTVQIDASQLSNIPTRAYRIQGLYIYIPSNYIPGKYPSYTRNRAGVNTGRYQPWNGTFYTAPSNNPAWVFYDMATNARYGAGEYIGYNNIDKWGLYQIAMYCDQLVPDGFGGWEVRFACNTYIQSQEQAWKVLSDLASVFRGLLYWGQGMVMATADMPKPIMHNFTCANVVDGRFTYQDTELKTRFSDTEVTYNDPNDFFGTKVQSCFDTDMRRRYGYRDSKFTSYGCTSRGQAHRHGEYVIVTNKYEVETVTFQTGFEAMYLRPGDIIGIMDNYRVGLRQGGRVKAFLAGGHYVQLDAVISPFPDGQEINFFIAQDSPTVNDNFGNSNQAAAIRPPDVWTGHIYGMAGRPNNVVYVQGAGGAAVPGYLSGLASVWVIGANLNNPNVPVAQFRIIGIAERAQNLYEITALTYQPHKFDLIDFGVQFTPPLMTRIQSLTYVLPPNNLTATLQATVSNNVITLHILLSWQQPPDDNIRSYQIWIQPPNGGWSYVTETSSTSYYVPTVITGLYHFRVNSVNTAGITSNPATVSITVPDTSLIVPHRMSGVEIQGQGNNFTYLTQSPVLAWRLNSPSKSFLFNSEAPYGVGIGSYDPYFVHFVVRVYDGSLGPLTDASVPKWTDFTTALQYTIDYAKNAAAWGDGKARHNLIVTVQDVDSYGLEFAPQPIYIDNPPPPPVTNLTAIVQAGTAPKVVGLSWIDPRTAPATAAQAVDINTVRIYKNSTNTFPGGTPYATIHSNSNVWNAIFSSGTYWFFVTTVDVFGSESTPTTGVQAVV